MPGMLAKSVAVHKAAVDRFGMVLDCSAVQGFVGRELVGQGPTLRNEKKMEVHPS
jgi:hypothetical protein